jgi:hypothetical protein
MMRLGPASLLLLPAAAATLLTSCANANLGAGTGSNPAKTTPVVTWTQPASISSATPLSSAQLDATANVKGSFTYIPAAGISLGPGTHSLSVTFTPEDTAHYNTATASVTISVYAGKKTPVITWNPPAPITNTTPLSAAQLDATADVKGSFVYTPGEGMVLVPGTQALAVTFNPDDSANYQPATAHVTIEVTAAENPISSSNCSSGPSTGATDFVYVSAGAWNSGQYRIEGYTPQPDGSLMAVSGSPFSTPGPAPLNTVGAGSSFFGVDGYTLYSYGIHEDGCLSLENSLVVAQGPQSEPWSTPLELFLNPDGSNLYSINFVPPEESSFASYSFDTTSGAVTMLANTYTGMSNDGRMLAFDSTGRYAVSSSCTIRTGVAEQVFQVGSDGGLSTIPIGYAPQPDMGAMNGFCPEGAAADHAGHFVIAGFLCVDPGGSGCEGSGPYQLAVYSIDSAGKMTTASTTQSMPVLDALDLEGGVGSYQFSPDNRYFAVSGFTGLEVFAWDTTNAVLTHIATLKDTEGSCINTSSFSGCTGNGFGNVAWDSHDRLYTYLGNQLFVYTVTDAGITQAPGSPHTLDSPQWVTVVSARPQ